MLLKPSFLRHNQYAQMKDESNIPFKAVTRVCVKQMEFQVNGIDSITARPMTSVQQTYGKFTFFLGSNYGCWQYVWRASVIVPLPITVSETVLLQRPPTKISSPASSSCLLYIESCWWWISFRVRSPCHPNISLCVSAFSLLHGCTVKSLPKLQEL